MVKDVSTNTPGIKSDKLKSSTDYPVKDNPKMDAGIAPRADKDAAKKSRP